MNAMIRILSIIAAVLTVSPALLPQTGLLINHQCTDLSQIPTRWIESAKSNLKIAYGHTSHGSQLITGMNALVTIHGTQYSFNSSGSGGALILHDYAMGGDVGSYPDWVNNTRSYLGTPDVNGCGSNHPEINVIIWSWCGQASYKGGQTMIDEYLAPMSQLEREYPNVKFVYMTGHLDGSGRSGSLSINDQQIRTFCIDSNKVLFDFMDIESYDPDGRINYMNLNANDNCDYDSNGTSVNWAQRWITANPGSDLALEAAVVCGSCCAHSQGLNCAMKARAAWWLWARVAGWNGVLPVQLTSFTAACHGMKTELRWYTATEINNYGFEIERRILPGSIRGGSNENVGLLDGSTSPWCTIGFVVGNGTSNSPHEYSYQDSRAESGRAIYRLKQIDNDGAFKYSQSIELEIPSVPKLFTLTQNYPNPFNPTTTIAFTLAEDSRVTLKVFTILGKEVATILNEEMISGRHHRVQFDASMLSSGIYFYRLNAGRNSLVKKLILVK